MFRLFHLVVGRARAARTCANATGTIEALDRERFAVDRGALGFAAA